MSIRPGQAKGPWVGTNGSAIPPVGDHKVLNSIADTTANYLSSKITTQPNSGILLTTLNPGGNEQLQIEVDGSLFDDEMVSITSNDQTTGFLDAKVVVAGGLTKSVLNPGASEQLQISGSGITGDGKVLNTVADTTRNYLSSKLAAGTGGISLTTLNAGGNEQTQIENTLTGSNVGTGEGLIFRNKTTNNLNLKSLKQGSNITITNNADDITIASSAAALDYKVKNTAADTTPGYLADKLTVEGMNIETDYTAGDENSNIRALPAFFDTFQTSRPFWVGTQAITSGDFTVDIANARINGTGTANAADWIRHGVDGDFDYIMAFDTNGAAQGGWRIEGNSVTVDWKNVPGSNQLQRIATGEAQVNVAYIGTVSELRVQKIFGTLRFYHRDQSGTAPGWILDNTLTKEIGYDVKLSFLQMNGGRITQVTLWDNKISQLIRSDCGKSIPLTDGATITPDLRMGNVFTVTLGGNRTFANPTENQVNAAFMWMVRFRQDASPPRTISSWGTKYRFPGGVTPTLTNGANKSDYFGFMYNATDDKWDCIAQEFNL